MSDRTEGIERNIQHQRGLLADAMGQVLNAVSPANLSGAIASDLQAKGAVVADAALERTKGNPLGVLLVGAGLAALVAGPKHTARPGPSDDASGRGPVDVKLKDPLTGEFVRRVEAAAEDHQGPSASALRKALNSGLANLPEPARRRVVKAREAAIAAQEQVEHRAAAAAREAAKLHNRQPWSTAALAFGLGALAGTALPRTRVEDETMGAQRDALMQEAEFILRDELAAASATGRAALHDGLDAAKERLCNP